MMRRLRRLAALWGGAEGLEPAAVRRIRIRTAIATVAAMAVGGGLLGALVVASGAPVITASSGHWPVTEWFLHFAMKRAVSTHSLGIQPPPLEEPWLAAKGAAHYDLGCRPCHGGPAQPHPVIPRAMTPHPPNLPPRIAEWQTRELFYIVKHGVKLTGMPAWPTQQRDDEVWAMVAFLRLLPELDQGEYRRMAYGGQPVYPAQSPDVAGLDADPPPSAVLETCARCHGAKGEGGGSGAFPRLAGQSRDYQLATLQAFSDGSRHSGLMQPIATALSGEEMGELADYYARRSAIPAAFADTGAGERGAEIAQRGVPANGIPACSSCHGPGSSPRNPRYPNLAGQPAAYLELQLRLFKEGRRGGTSYSHLMREVAPRLSERQIRDAAAYYSKLPSEPQARIAETR